MLIENDPQSTISISSTENLQEQAKFVYLKYIAKKDMSELDLEKATVADKEINLLLKLFKAAIKLGKSKLAI